MHRHVVTVDRNSHAMYAELHKMHGSLSAAEGNGVRIEAQLQTMQQQLVRMCVCVRACTCHLFYVACTAIMCEGFMHVKPAAGFRCLRFRLHAFRL